MRRPRDERQPDCSPCLHLSSSQLCDDIITLVLLFTTQQYIGYYRMLRGARLLDTSELRWKVLEQVVLVTCSVLNLGGTLFSSYYPFTATTHFHIHSAYY
ncbi:hypothetical protein E2C01_079874 [Portunus trituberculatus]|uniref:Uncharacterized protein n=1 Tax=Portunus trituberculatus TaxID=210409 RepID=A0A5B7IRP0_PORTR|nr:hypothetical protein [Portunus trituberculatus]